MKTTVTLLIVGLFILATPMFAAAHGRQHRNHNDADSDRGNRIHTASVYEHQGFRSHARTRRHRLQREKRQLRRELRETRRELHRVERRIRRQQRRPYYAVQPYSVRPPVILGIPQLVFQFGW